MPYVQSVYDQQVALNKKYAGQPGWVPLKTDGIMGPKTQAAMSFTPTMSVAPKTTTTSTSTPTTTSSTSKTTTTTGTAPKTTTTTSTATPKPTGIATINSTLNIGSQGDQVKALQQYLAGLGYTNADGTPLKVDGIYGPKTQTAVMQFQTSNGLKADGIFGPLSLAKTQSLTSTSAQAGTPAATPAGQFNTGDPSQDALLGELQNFIKTQQDSGLKLNPDFNFDDATLNKFLETAKASVHPYFQNQIDTIKQDVLRTAPQILQNYQNDIAKQQQDFTQNLGDTRNNFANQGLAYSGFRGEGEQNLQTNENRTLQDLSQNAQNDLYNLGRGAESKIGASNAPTLGSLSNYSATTAGQGGFNLGSTVSPYTPGGYGTGSIQYDENQAAEARRQALLTSASNAVVAGRSYSDLLR